MALVLKDRVKETTTTTGTGTVTLAGAAAGFQSFAAVGNGNQTFYAIVDSATGDWEVGVGTYTSSGTSLSRTTVVSSSNAGSLVNFGAGAKDVFVTYPSSRAVYLDAAGSAVTTLDIGTLGTSTANITTANITSGTIATAPTGNTDIVNKQYADAIASGIHFHEAVELATTAALPANTYNNGTGGVGATLTANANGALSVDSTLTVANNRILVKNEAAGANNGVYVVTQVGSAGTPYILTRATDFDSAGTGVDQIDEGDFFLVTSGTVNVNTAWVQQTPPPITVGTTAIVFQQFSAPITYTAGTGLNESPTYTFNIANIGTAGTYGDAATVPVITTNAQGQVTGVTPTAIAITGAQVSGNISGSAGSVANALTAGTFLTSGGTFDGSAARTFAVDATDANTASKVVARDASGNFSAGTITATLSGLATSATTATNLAGGAANQIPFQTGSGATSFAVTPTASNQVLNWNGSAFTWSAGTISGIPLGSNLSTLTFGTFLTGTSYNGSGAVTLATNATNANTASTLVARDASGNFSAGTITAALSGNATTATTATNVSGTVAVANGGTGSTTLTANNVLLGNGTSALQVVAPGTTGNVLTSNGTTWTSAAAASGSPIESNPAIIDDQFTLTTPIAASLINTVNAYTLDADREFVLLNNNVAFVYNRTTNTAGAMVSLRATTATSQIAVVVDANKVLVASCSNASTALEVVAVSISGTTCTVGTPSAVALAGNFSSLPNQFQQGGSFRFVAVGSSYVLGYVRDSGVKALRAITVSGTTVTVGSETALTGSNTQLGQLFTHSSSVVLAFHASTATVYASPYTVSGTTLTIGTEATVTLTSGSGSPIVLGGVLPSGRYIAGLPNSLLFSMATISGTTASWSATVSSALSNLAAAGQGIPIGTTNTVLVFLDNSSNFALLRDNAGTLERVTETNVGGNNSFAYPNNNAFHRFNSQSYTKIGVDSTTSPTTIVVNAYSGAVVAYGQSGGTINLNTFAAPTTLFNGTKAVNLIISVAGVAVGYFDGANVKSVGNTYRAQANSFDAASAWITPVFTGETTSIKLIRITLP